MRQYTVLRHAALAMFFASMVATVGFAQAPKPPPPDIGIRVVVDPSLTPALRNEDVVAGLQVVFHDPATHQEIPSPAATVQWSVASVTKDGVAFGGSVISFSPQDIATTLTVSGGFADVGLYAITVKVRVENEVEWNPSYTEATTVVTVRVQSARIVITSATPNGTLPLGSDLSLEYRIDSPEGGFQTVWLEVRNRYDTLVYRCDGLGQQVGTHAAEWLGGRWNQEGSTALANPGNGPYQVTVNGYRSADPTRYSAIIQIRTLLVIETDLEDPKPTDGIASGLDPAMLDPNEGDDIRLRVGLKNTGSAPTVWAGMPPAFGAVVYEDLDNDGTDELKSAHVCQQFGAEVPNGTYHVVLRNCRDLAGNPGPGDAEGVVQDWTIELR